MAKHSYEFKKKIVLEYLNSDEGCISISRKYGMASSSQLLKWVAAYKAFGDDGLKRSRSQKIYSFKEKLSVVESYLTNEISYQELAIQVGINNPSMIARWVNEFRIAGPDALRSHKKGRKRTLNKSQTKKTDTQVQQPMVDISVEHVKELEDENLKLRIENAFFKRTEETAFRGRSKNERVAKIISSLRRSFKLKDLLSYTQMPKATYMYWQKRFDRVNPDQEVEDKIQEIRSQHKDYGYRRMTGELKNQGICVNKKKVQRIMQKLSLQVTSFTRKSRKYSSYKGKVGTIAPNRIHRRFETNIPHQKITTDTSEFKYYEVDTQGHLTLHKLYLDPFLDMFDDEIISYGIAKRPSAESILEAQAEAIEITADCPYRRTFHSDQGWAYQMKAYTRKLKKERIFQSMSRKGNCHDNAVMENFFGLMKQEMYYGVIYYSYEELKAAIERYIKYYNEQRIKEKLGWKSPVQYRLSLLAA
uniref:IS3 family transposase n=1 Tax=Acidaminococcus massiliensis TaxID=1852375 RepID=UPI001E54869E|nr:IS3 family transposase [Acidaminococcus massiliensis]